MYFSGGKIRFFDATELVTKGVFQELKDKAKFKETCTVLNDTLAWDLSERRDPKDCLDLDPEKLYETCPEVEEPDIDALRMFSQTIF